MILSFSLSLLLDGIILIIIRNPIHNVLLLILIFLKSSIIIMMLKIEFLALLLLLVYLGAVAVLFIFVVMMLNIKILEKQEQIIQYMPLTLLIAIWIFFILDILINITFYWEGTISFYKNWLFLFKNMSNVKLLGEILYSVWHVVVLIASLILLIAMLGSIALALLKSKKHTNNYSSSQSEIINYTFKHYKNIFNK